MQRKFCPLEPVNGRSIQWSFIPLHASSYPKKKRLIAVTFQDALKECVTIHMRNISCSKPGSAGIIYLFKL